MPAISPGGARGKLDPVIGRDEEIRLPFSAEPAHQNIPC